MKKIEFRIVGLILAIICLGAFITNVMHKAAQIEKANKLVTATAKLFDDDEDFPEHTILDPDPWGNALRIKIAGEAFKDCKVTSAGPDKVFDTEDDISKINMNFHPISPDARAVGEAIGKTTGRFGIGLGRGLVEAVKDEFKKEP